MPNATAALVLGIIGLIVPVGILSILAIVFGAKGRRAATRDPALLGKGKATAGLVLGILGLLWTVAIVGIIANFAANEELASNITVGRCYEQPDTSESVFSLTKQDCDGPHDTEAYAVFDLPDGDYPGLSTAQRLVAERCQQEFEAFVGTPLFESELDVTYFYPVEDAWPEDREGACLVFDPAGQTTGTLQGADR